MTALAIGSAFANADSRVLYTHLLQPTGRKPTQSIEYHYTEYHTGLVLYINHTPVAWIVSGHHTGRIEGQLKTCIFIDVVYYRHTEYGINLETFEAETVAEAQYHLAVIFRLEVVA